MSEYDLKDAVFMAKEAANALIQSKRTVSEAEQEFTEQVTRYNSELLGVLPYFFCLGAYFFENFKPLIIDNEGATHYQIGAPDNPLPLDKVYKYTIGPYTEQKEHLHAELYRYMHESRKYWLPTKNGMYAFDEPLRIIPYVKGERIEPKVFHTLVTKQEGGEYKQEVKEKLAGFVLQFYKPLFEGHFNGWQNSGGFIKQPPLFYAIARHYHDHMPTANFKEFTPIKIVQTFYYLATHCNGKGDYITIDVLNMLKHILGSALKEDTIRYDRILPVLSALGALTHITNTYPTGFDFIFNSADSIRLETVDWMYADEQLKAKINEQKALMLLRNSKEIELERLQYAVKHHLRAHANQIEVNVKYKERKETGKKKAGCKKKKTND